MKSYLLLMFVTICPKNCVKCDIKKIELHFSIEYMIEINIVFIIGVNTTLINNLNKLSFRYNK